MHFISYGREYNKIKHSTSIFMGNECKNPELIPYFCIV